MLIFPGRFKKSVFHFQCLLCTSDMMLVEPFLFFCFVRLKLEHCSCYKREHGWFTGVCLCSSIIQKGEIWLLTSFFTNHSKFCKKIELQRLVLSRAILSRNTCVTPGINPLCPKLYKHILLTAFHLFLIGQVGRICLNIKTFYPQGSFPVFSLPVCLIYQRYSEVKLYACHCWGSMVKSCKLLYFFVVICVFIGISMRSKLHVLTFWGTWRQLSLPTSVEGQYSRTW